MIREHKYRIRIASFIASILVYILSFWVAFFTRSYLLPDNISGLPLLSYILPDNFSAVLPFNLYFGYMFIAVALFAVVVLIADVADSWISGNLVNFLKSSFKISIWYFISTLVAHALFKVYWVSRMFLGVLFISLFIFLVLAKYIFKHVTLRILKQANISKHVILFGDRVLNRQTIAASEKDSLESMNFVKVFNETEKIVHMTDRKIEELSRALVENIVDEIYVTKPIHEIVGFDRILNLCLEIGVKVKFLLPLFDSSNYGPFIPYYNISFVDTEFGKPYMTIYSGRPDSFSYLMKRVFDYLFAAVILLLLSPLFLIIAIGVKLSSKGSVIFKQERVGLNGRAFHLYKFRTMVANAEELKDTYADINEIDGPAFKSKNDPRITRIGRFLRRFSLDELPQLLNVLKGEMSLVGPRPPLPSEVKRYAMWCLKRLCVRPGITGLWQVEGRTNIPNFEDWVRLDLKYIHNWSLGMDFKIMIKTVKVVLSGKGAM